ncbi:MAG: hypothetical protein E7359_02395 [Clostridiales bacterium]|nr:hypothetical protein [Clostridiales bacterium]
MRKLKTLFALIICMCSSIILFACNKKPIKVETITLSEENIILRPFESKDIIVTISPDKAVNKNIRYILSDDNAVELTISDTDPYKATVTAKDVLGPISSYLQVVTEDNSVYSESIKITVYTERTKLFTPQNLEYDYLNQMIKWDKIEASSGYSLLVDIEGEEQQEIICSTNQYKINDFFNKIISVKVKSLGDDIVYSDSEYSESTFKFIQADEVKNLTNDNYYVKFDKVINAESYNIFVYDTVEKENPDYTYSVLDVTYNPDLGFRVKELENAGKTYIIKVQAIPKNNHGIENVVLYPSLTRNSITINKFDTPTLNELDFVFTYSTNTLSWKANTNASGYVLTRTGETQAEYAQYIFNDCNENYFVIDTANDKLKAGKYNYSIKILGNNKEYLDSNTSENLLIEKLAAPSFYVSEGKLNWNSVQNSGGYLLKIDEANFIELSSQTNDYILGQKYNAKEYSFVIKAEGNGENSITSEASEIFKATKLEKPNKAYLNTDCKNVEYSATSFVDTLKIYTTLNSSTVVYEQGRNDLKYNDTDKTKTLSIDMSLSNFDEGEYQTYAVAYGEGYLKSEPSETYNFSKLSNLNTAKILDGELIYSKIEGAETVLVYINGSLVEDFDPLNYNFIDNQNYDLRLQYIPKANANIVMSNISDSFDIKKLAAPIKLYVEDGEIKYQTIVDYGAKFYIHNGITLNIASSLDLIELEENNIYTIKMCHDGGSEFLNSDFSNSITVKLTDSINTFKLVDDTLSFEDIGASYEMYVMYNEESQVGTKSKSLGINTSISLKELITSESMFGGESNPIHYNNLKNYLTIYIASIGDSLYEPIGNENIVVKLNRQTYGKNLTNISNKINVQILPSPTNLRVPKILNIVSDTSLRPNDLYFDLNSNAELFEFSYEKNNEKQTRILSTVNYLTKIDEDTYLIDTSFMEGGAYNLSIKAISNTRTYTNPNLEVVYNINSFDVATLNNIEKLNAVSKLTCENGEIVIDDSDTDYLYVLTINGEEIFDDILEDGQDINYILNLAGTNQSQALELVKKFKSKTRVLPSKYNKTFNLNVRKYSIPTTTFGLLLETAKIKSNLTESITVTRLSRPNIVLKDGILQWTSVENAESYEVTVNKVGEGIELLQKVTVNKNESLSVDLFNLLSKSAGDYQVYVEAKTTVDYQLSSGISDKIDFTILNTPTIVVENGILRWEPIPKSNGYKLDIYNSNNELITNFEFNNTILSYDAMKKANGNIIESGNYTFVIKALGELGGKEESTIISSVETTLNATKLQTPEPLYLSDGSLVFTKVNNNVGVKNYILYVNSDEENIATFNADTLNYELPEKYKAGNYSLYYQAIGKNNYLTSNISDKITAEKLNATDSIYLASGEIYWNEVIIDNYKNSDNEDVVYNLNVKMGDSVKQQNQTNVSYIMSEDDSVESGLYTIEVKTIGDSFNYLTSNAKVLENVVKLDYIKDFRIYNGKLVWTSPSVVNGTKNNTKSSPNSLLLKVSKGGVNTEYYLEDLTNEFIAEKESSGDYTVSVQNLGNESGLVDDYYFVNSKIVEFGKTVKKLDALTNLNINDGINISWINHNKLYNTNKVVLNMVKIVNNVKTYYSGVVADNNSSFAFESLAYYVNAQDENVLILKTDINITTENDKKYYNGYEVKYFTYDGVFDLNVVAFGDDKYLNSNKSNTISIELPESVKNLKVEHGKVTWDKVESANGYIISLSRVDKNGASDIEYNNYNKLIYVNDNYYNLSDVNYKYTISVRSYAVISDSTQSMASEPTIIENYIFNSFTLGSGELDNPYIITNEEELKLIKYNNKASYKLEADIVLSGNFKPLFDETNPFVGTLSGYKDETANYKISNLTITTSYQYTGLLGYIETKTVLDDRVITTDVNGFEENVRTKKEIVYVGELNNINFVSVNISQGLNVGTIAGYSNGLIKNIEISGNVNSNTEAAVDIGASMYSINSGSVVAENKGTILNVINNASVWPTAKTSLYSGGIAAKNMGVIKNVENNGTVSGTISGGIVSINSGEITASVCTSDIYCSSYNAGGATLTALAGGIAGQNQVTGLINNCYVNNKNFDNAVNSGIICASTENIIIGGEDQIVYIGGLVGINAGKCFNNLVKIKIWTNLDNILVHAGKLFGYNENNTVQYNYTLTSLLGIANNLVYNIESSVAIDNTNTQVETFVSDDIVNALNNNNLNNNIVDITWKIADNNIMFVA